jgi:hypothetical protein
LGHPKQSAVHGLNLFSMALGLLRERQQRGAFSRLRATGVNA